MTGYLHAQYAQSLADFGRPTHLPESGSWILERQVPDTPYLDAMGCYPIFACEDWSRLPSDLEQLEGVVLGLSVVTDPFGEYDAALLHRCFPFRVQPFKQHFVVDLEQPLESFVHPHHLRNARKAGRVLRVELCPEPLEFLNDWVGLYEALVERHSIKGLAAFSRDSFAKQLMVPGLVALRAVADAGTEGMLLWYQQGEIAYYHLGAYSARGYDLRASFALFSTAIEYFAAQGLRWLNLGGAAGAGEGQSSGLSRFKEGWSTGVRTAYFCARIMDHEKYQELVKAKGMEATEYFPAYRLGEFG
ncbi:MAG: hypothetical protein JWM21_4567 [Acidobacteria bacterium]|nr:hypothetical protein [Acidobacteriota bacterium]